LNADEVIKSKAGLLSAPEDIKMHLGRISICARERINFHHKDIYKSGADPSYKITPKNRFGARLINEIVVLSSSSLPLLLFSGSSSTAVGRTNAQGCSRRG
jgi:hypothetical protein